jgi:Lrp/AsnC family transcriptional regulator for asnA, asnC and gidA
MPKVNIDSIDRKILQYLVRNARMPFLEIARECGISGAAIHQRVKKLDEMGVILGSRLEVDPKTLGFDVCALVGIRIAEPSMSDETVAALKSVPEIVECHFITGEYNMMMKIYCLDNEHLMHTLFDKILPIQGVIKTETFISLREIFSRQIDVRHLEQ